MKVLVVGSGAREHAIVRSIARDPSVEEVVAAPGNPGIAELATCVPLAGGVTDSAGVVALAREVAADLVVIGPEAPLVAGVADAVRAAGIPCFGPSAEAARLEGSKAFAKEVMSAAEVPTGLAHVCTTLDEVEAALDAFGAPHVVKDDGLAAGKGVVVTDDREQALEHARACLAKPDGAVVVEEFLSGPEVSLFCLCDGTTVRAPEPRPGLQAGARRRRRVPTPAAWGPTARSTGHPRTSPTTSSGGSPSPSSTRCAAGGHPSSGVLYVGLALTSRGPRVIEFNARFGDPETQVVLARLRSPLGEPAARGRDGPPRERPAVALVRRARRDGRRRGRGIPRDPSHG